VVKFGGRREPQQCPVCDSRSDYSGFGSPATRIAQARAGHLTGCPATEVDPTKLESLTRTRPSRSCRPAPNLRPADPNHGSATRGVRAGAAVRRHPVGSGPRGVLNARSAENGRSVAEGLQRILCSSDSPGQTRSTSTGARWNGCTTQLRTPSGSPCRSLMEAATPTPASAWPSFTESSCNGRESTSASSRG